MMIFRYMSGEVYQGSWIDKYSGKVVKYFGTKRGQLKAPDIKKNYLKTTFTIGKKEFMIDQRAHWH